MRDKIGIDWGGLTPRAPSMARIRPVAWIKAGALWGAVLFAAALVVLWRDLPGYPAPALELPEELFAWASALARFMAPSLASVADDPERAKQALASSDAVGLRVALAFVVAALPLPIFGLRYLRPRDGLIHLRGSRRFEGPCALREINRKLRDRVRRRPDHDLGPGLPYPADLWTRHVLLVGGTGAGKSTVIRPLLQRVVAADERLIVFDPKCEFTESFDLPIIGPWDARSFAWDIGADMRNVGDMRRFANSIVKEGHDPMWANAARQILVGFMLYLRDSRGPLWGWRELADMLSTPESELRMLMWRYNREAVRAVEKASVTTTGILINLAAFCSPIYDLANAWGDAPADRRISFVDWTLNPATTRRQIILQGHGSYPDITKGYIQGIIGCVAAIVNSVELADDATRKLWIVADELPQMGSVPIRALFEMGRSRGMRCVVACQDLAQLEEIHGEKTVKALVSMTGTLLVGQVGRGDTAEALAKALGSREVERENESITLPGAGEGKGSRAVSFAREELAIYKPSELGSRLGLDPKRGGVVMALALEGDAYELFWPHAPATPIRPGHMPAAWTFGLDLARDDPPPSRDVFSGALAWEALADGDSKPASPGVAFGAGSFEAEISRGGVWSSDSAAEPVSDLSDLTFLFGLDEDPAQAPTPQRGARREKQASGRGFEIADEGMQGDFGECLDRPHANRASPEGEEKLLPLDQAVLSDSSGQSDAGETRRQLGSTDLVNRGEGV